MIAVARPIRVAHVITDLDVGGAEVMLARLLPPLAGSGIDNVVVSLRPPGPIAAAIRDAGAEVFSLGMHPNRPNPLALVRLWRILKQVRPDIVQTWLYHADLVGLLAAMAAGVPRVVWNIRCAELDPADHPRSLRSVLRLLASLSARPAAVICNSEAGRLAHQRLGYSPRQWEIISNGFDTDRFSPSIEARMQLRSALGVPADCRLVGLLARYHPMKDHVTFFRAAQTIVQEQPDVYVVAAGRGVPESASVRELVHSLGIAGRVRLLGEAGDPARFLAALDVAVSSSYSEAFPNVVGEAMACGVSCVVTDVGESRMIVGDTGVVVPPRDPASLGAAVLEQLRRPPNELRASGDAARARIVREFSIGRVAARYRDLYRSLAAGVVDEASACVG